MTDEDIHAVYEYLQSIDPVENLVPAAVGPMNIIKLFQILINMEILRWGTYLQQYLSVEYCSLQAAKKLMTIVISLNIRRLRE